VDPAPLTVCGWPRRRVSWPTRRSAWALAWRRRAPPRCRLTSRAAWSLRAVAA